jgi:O-antigen/teichoic acid export membrane protein
MVLLLNFILTPIFLQYGATSASLLGHLFILVTGYYFSKRYYKITFSFAKDVFIFFFFFAISFIAIHFPLVDNSILNILLQTGILFLLAWVILILIFPPEYRSLIKLIKGINLQGSGNKTGVEIR